jgi:hypothetical protein
LPALNGALAEGCSGRAERPDRGPGSRPVGQRSVPGGALEHDTAGFVTGDPAQAREHADSPLGRERQPATA